MTALLLIAALGVAALLLRMAFRGGRQARREGDDSAALIAGGPVGTPDNTGQHGHHGHIDAGGHHGGGIGGADGGGHH